MVEFLDQIQTLIRARYPIVYLISHEENRSIRLLRQVVQAEHMELWVWRTSDGLNGEACTATEALERLASYDEPTLLVFLDAHQDWKDVQWIRKIRDENQSMVQKGHAVVLISPKYDLPLELEKLVTPVDVPLPSSEEVHRLFSFFCQQQDLQLPSPLFQQFVLGALGLTESEIKRMYSRIALVGNGFTQADLALQVQEKKRMLRSSQFLEFWDVNHSALSVGGLDSLKEWLVQRQLAFTPDARIYGLPEPKGLFLLGVQGCGKSLMAKVVAQMWKMPLLRLDVAAVLQGGAEDGLRQTIRIAESLAPAILWIDELEKGFAGTDEAARQSMGTLLTWMQEKKEPVFVVATANEVRALPPELLRKGRFDEIFFVDLPDPHERLEILDIHLRQRNRNPANFDLTVVVEESERYSGAELEQVVVGAMFKSYADGREVDTDDLINSVREIVPLAVTMDDQLKDLRDWARSRARRASADRRRANFFVAWDEG